MTTIEQRVMASVAVIHVGRTLVGATALKFYALVISVAGITTLVSVSNVATNFSNVAQGGAGSIATFLVSAVLATDIVVQLALALAALAAASLMVDMVRSFSSHSYSRAFTA